MLLGRLLIVGGLVGLGIGVYLAALLAPSQWVPLPTWAAVLFAIQNPIPSVPGFNYEYYTGLRLPIASDPSPDFQLPGNSPRAARMG
jgi:hypothetical protein